MKFKTIVIDGVEYALVPPKKLFSLIEGYEEMSYYESAGVDNWEGRDYAIDLMREENFHENFEDDDWLRAEFLEESK